MKNHFPGSNVAMITPFTADGSKIDYGALKEFIEWQIAEGTDGLIPAGCTGEAATMSHEEHREIIKFTVETVAGRCKVIPGTGSNNTAEATKLTCFAKEVGADGALIITPYYNKPTPEGQFLHYKALNDAVKDFPIMLYNVPGRTGIKMTPETIARLHRELENVVCIKEACGSVDQVSSIRAISDIEILSGDDSLTVPMMAVGASGVVSVVANILPGKVKKMCAAANAGDFTTARALHYELLDLAHGLFMETNPICIKTALAATGRVKSPLRLPLCPMAAANEAKLRDILKKSGLL